MIEGNVDLFIDYLRLLELHITKPKRAQEQIYSYMRNQLWSTYALKGARDMSEWAPLKEATVKQKRRKGYSRPESPMIATGKAMSSYYPEYSDDEMRIKTTSEDYLKYHEFPGNRTKLPWRPTTFFAARDYPFIGKIYLSYILGLTE